MMEDLKRVCDLFNEISCKAINLADVVNLVPDEYKSGWMYILIEGLNDIEKLGDMGEQNCSVSWKI